MSVITSRELSFISGGEVCAATLYRPEGEGPHPLVVLAHGFAGTRKGRLWAYGERFAEAGIAAFVFDYRCFGESTGEPRQLLSISRQQRDWEAAIAFARSLEGIDSSRVALWGTSFAGGHVVTLAAGDPRISAVISQTPFTDGPSALRAVGPAGVVKLSLAGLRDVGRMLRGAEPYLLPVVSEPGGTAAMSQPGSYDGYLALYEDRADFTNAVCARATVEVAAYFPARSAARLECPLLVLTCENDRVTPPSPARRMAERAPSGRSIEYEGAWGHFDIYVGELFERTIADQIEFLRAELLTPAPQPAAVA